MIKQETRKEEIVRVSAQLFKERGYSAVTMRDIAQALEIKAASLYYHITSKQGILEEIIISLAEQFTEGMDEIHKSKDNTLVKLERIIKLHIRITSFSPYGMSSLNSDWMHLENSLDYYLKMRADYENNFRSILQEGIEKSEIIQEDVEVMLFSILSTLRSLYLWMPKREIISAEALAQKLSTIMLRGIVL